MLKKVLLLLFVIALTGQAKEVAKRHSEWSIICSTEHGQIVPNTHIVVDFFNDLGFLKRRYDGLYTEDGCIECDAFSEEYNEYEIHYKIKYRFQNEEGKFNPKNKNKPQISVVSVSFADKVKLGCRDFTVKENDSIFILTSDKSINFDPSTNKMIYSSLCFSPYPIIGSPQSMSIKVPKGQLTEMYNKETNELNFKGEMPVNLIYENGRAEGLVSVRPYGFTIEKGKLTLNTGEVIVVDREKEEEYYAITIDGTKLLPAWYKKYKDIQPNKGETLTHYYHRAYTADSLFQAQKAQKEQKEIENKKRETDLIAQVEALGETPYQKALKSLQDKYLKRFEQECWVSSETILGGIMVSGIAVGLSKITNLATVAMEFAPCLVEAMTKRPATCRAIMADLEKEMGKTEILELRQPVEKELEDLQMKRVNEKLSNK